MGEKSILHAVRATTKRKRLNTPTKPLCETLEELQLNESTSSTQSTPEKFDINAPNQNSAKAHFYVYCSSPCKSVKTGKLRVRCAECKYGAFEVDNDPQSWADVLESKRITGDCNNIGCDAVYAEFYFKCAEHPSQGENDEAVPLYLIRTNIKEIPCLACTDVR